MSRGKLVDSDSLILPKYSTDIQIVIVLIELDKVDLV